MGIVFPNEAVARRWEGALQARLRRAPVEAFLRARSLAPARAGIAKDSDDLVRATVLIVESGLALYLAGRSDGLAFRQRAALGHAACLVSSALAELISEPGAWRIVALVSTARLLSPWIGLNAAAVTSASTARRFQKEVMKATSLLDRRIRESARAAVSGGGADAMAQVAASIADCLHIVSSSDCIRSAEDSRGLQAGS